MPSDPSALNTLAAFPSVSTAVSSDRMTGVEAEVSELFGQYRERLLRYLLSLGLTISDGEEVVQEVFLSLFQHLQRGKSRSNLRGWIFRVAHNLGLKRRCRSRRDPETLTSEDSTIDPAPSPEDQLSQNQTQSRVLAVVRALPEQDRRCLALRAEGLRYREIAEILEMSLGAVSLSLTRSLARVARSAER